MEVLVELSVQTGGVEGRIEKPCSEAAPSLSWRGRGRRRVTAAWESGSLWDLGPPRRAGGAGAERAATKEATRLVLTLLPEAGKGCVTALASP